MCACLNCRTGKCGCTQCADGPGIDFEMQHTIYEGILMDVIRERARIRDLRAQSPERQKVRRWGDAPELTTGDQENGDQDDLEHEQ